MSKCAKLVVMAPTRGTKKIIMKGFMPYTTPTGALQPYALHWNTTSPVQSVWVFIECHVYVVSSFGLLGLDMASLPDQIFWQSCINMAEDLLEVDCDHAHCHKLPGLLGHEDVLHYDTRASVAHLSNPHLDGTTS